MMQLKCDFLLMFMQEKSKGDKEQQANMAMHPGQHNIKYRTANLGITARFNDVTEVATTDYRSTDEGSEFHDKMVLRKNEFRKLEARANG